MMDRFYGRSAAALTALLVSIACEGEHRPYSLVSGPDASFAGGPETAAPALVPGSSPSPSGMLDDGAQQQPGRPPSGMLGDGSPLQPNPVSPPPSNASTADGSDQTVDAGPAPPAQNCDCSGTPATPLCKTAAGAPALSGTCVACLSNADCADPNAPRCDQQLGLCSTCLSNQDCVSVEGKTH